MKAALQIVDTSGLPALSMRRLGSLLDVDPMAIYYHLPNKAALYDAIVEAVMMEIDLSGAPALSPHEQLKGMAMAYTRALLAHPNAIPVVASRPVRTPASLRTIEKMLAVIMQLGFTPRKAIALVDVCGHFILGWVQTYAAHLQDSEMHHHDEMPLDQLPPDEFPNLYKVMAGGGAENLFAVELEMGLDALLRGLSAEPG